MYVYDIRFFSKPTLECIDIVFTAVFLSLDPSLVSSTHMEAAATSKEIAASQPYSILH